MPTPSTHDAAAPGPEVDPGLAPLVDDLAAAQLAIDALVAPGPDAGAGLREPGHLLRQTQAALRRIEHRFRTILAGLQAGFVVHGPDRRITAFNRQAADLLGVTDEQMRGRLPDDPAWRLVAIDGGPIAEVELPYRRAFATRKPVRDVILGAERPQRGELVWLLINANPILNPQGDVAEVIVTFMDISARIEAERAQREQAQLLDHASDAIVVHDLNHRVLYWNKGAERIYGWPAAEAVGRNALQLHVGELEPFQSAFECVLAKGEWMGEVRPRTKTGAPLVVQCRSTLIRDASGRPKSILLINTDITEKRRLEAQFLRAQRLESIGSLASGVAHDLNNVLTPIRMAVGLLKLKLPPTDAEGQRVLASLETNAARGAQLVRQVLGFGRGDDGEKIIVQPAHLAQEVAQIVADTFPKSIRLHTSLERELWTIRGDPTNLHQVILNLCLNARDAMADGGRLSIVLRNVVVGESRSGLNAEVTPGKYVAISVGDSGCGIPAGIRDKIFEPFFTTKAKDKGTGLGLSTVQAIIKGHAGFIGLDSQENRGSTFTVYLPAEVTAQPSGEPSDETAVAAGGNNQLILVVEDEDAIRLVARNILERFGYRVLLAENGVQAVSLFSFHREEIALVITDLAMPLMDGPTTILALRSLLPAVKIIASSGVGTQAAPEAAWAVGVGVPYFIAKPYTAEALLKLVAKVLMTG
jgi:PAS domain S-box-containing protein